MNEKNWNNMCVTIFSTQLTDKNGKDEEGEYDPFVNRVVDKPNS